MSVSKISAEARSRAEAALRAKDTPAAPAAQAGRKAAARQADQVTISEAARALSAARKAVAETPDVREQRVSSLKAAIADGSYSVDSHLLAGDIVKELES
jgi:negative regulator of flagellin synthesis FlgM